MVLYIVQAMTAAISQNNNRVVVVPVASVWTGSEECPGPYKLPLVDVDIPMHDTQVLRGERVRVIEERDNGWCRVRIPGQPHFNRKTGVWGVCDGWMKRAHLAVDDGAIISSLAAQNLFPNVATGLSVRERLVAYARSLVDSPYCWGGRSIYNASVSDVLTGVDCSGLVSLIYGACGITVPRNSHPQFVRAVPVVPKNMQPGDCLFFKREKFKQDVSSFERVVHVMVFVGEDTFVEASEDCKMVRVVTAQERLGCSLALLNNGDWVDGQGHAYGMIEVHAGTFFC